jgi:hypothetical protein
MGNGELSPAYAGLRCTTPCLGGFNHLTWIHSHGSDSECTERNEHERKQATQCHQGQHPLSLDPKHDRPAMTQAMAAVRLKPWPLSTSPRTRAAIWSHSYPWKNVWIESAVSFSTKTCS